MKAKTINAVLRKLVDDWAASIEDERVREVVKQNAIVTGGAIASMLLKEPVNDYDIYFRTREAVLAVATYYVGRFKAQTEGVADITTAVREADKAFVSSGGSSRHYVRECLMPALESHGMSIVVIGPGIESAGGEVVGYGCQTCLWSTMIEVKGRDYQKMHDDAADEYNEACRAPVTPLGKLGGDAKEKPDGR